MKISNKQKKENRRRLLRAAVEAMAESGYESVSLRQISEAARMSDPVIYSYFPNKPSLLYGYFLDSLEEALASVARIPGLAEMTFVEQVQLLMESHLAILEKDKAFVRRAFPLVFVTGLSTAQEALLPSRRLFSTYVDECLNEAIRGGELGAPPFQETIVSMFWDFHVGVLHYWSRDSSEMQAATSELIQRSLSVIQEVLKSAFLHRAVDLAYFMIRTHLLAPSLKGAAAAGPDGLAGDGKAKRRPSILGAYDA